MNSSLALLLALIPLLPLAGCALNGFFGRRMPQRAVAAIGTLFVAASFALACIVAFQFSGLPAAKIPYITSYGPWILAGSFQADFGMYLDQLSLIMILIVTGVGLLIHIYSVGYMEHEGGFYRFFCYLNLFMFFMLTLVLASGYLLLFVGWEGVGLASYLLIGFFLQKDSAVSAGKKAFIVNRIGDFGFLIGMFLIIQKFGTLNYDYVFRHVANMPIESAGAGLLTAVALLLMAGACGKSAQLPLYIWLPDAMEGPTPVSALIHAATMVTAGVYVVARSNLIFSRAPIALTVVAVIGVVTSFFAATIGMAQNDIKKVLAYSTISQLGYMFLACGVAAYAAGIFHLMTHAFFKALLFLAAGSVIHALGGEQDMRHMGGLRKKIPWTFWTMTAATLAISGTPFFSGFYSKDEILWNAWSSPFYGHWSLWLIGVITAGLTAFYMFRLWFMTFFGERRAPAHGHSADQHEPEKAPAHPNPPEPLRPEVAHGAEEDHVHESPWIMLAPLVVLGILSVIGGYVGVPASLGGGNHFARFLEPAFPSAQFTPAHVAASHPQPPAAPAESDFTMERVLTGASVGAGLIGFFFAWLLYFKRRDLPQKITDRISALYRLVVDKYRVDELYGRLFVRPVVEGSRRLLWRQVDVGAIDALVNEAAAGAEDLSDRARRMQSGNLRSYAGWVALGAAAVVAYMIWVGVH